MKYYSLPFVRPNRAIRMHIHSQMSAALSCIGAFTSIIAVLGALPELKKRFRFCSGETPTAEFEHKVVALGIFAVHPPGEGDEHFVKNSFEKSAISVVASVFARSGKRAKSCPRDDRGINIAEIPLVCRDLAIWVLIPFAQDEIELALRKFRINERKGNAMKGRFHASCTTEISTYLASTLRVRCTDASSRSFVRVYAPAAAGKKRDRLRAIGPRYSDKIVCSKAFPPAPGVELQCSLLKAPGSSVA